MIAALVGGPAGGMVLEVRPGRRLLMPVPRPVDELDWAPTSGPYPLIASYTIAVYEICLQFEGDLLYGFSDYE